MQAMDDDVADDKSLLIVLVETNPVLGIGSRKGEHGSVAFGLSPRFASDDYIFE